MSYFPTEKKQLIDRIKPTEPNGPGSYLIDKTASNQKSYAPFGSLTRPSHAVKAPQKDVLGPGHYQINRDLVKPSIQQYENNNCIIIKINDDGSSQFKSKNKRFADNLKADTPGPGAYSIPESKSQKKRQRAFSMGSSISRPKQLNDYKESLKPTLVSDPVLVVEQPEKQVPVKSKGFVRWDLNKKERFHTEPREYFTEQDKAAAIQQIKMGRKKVRATRESSSFASRSVKSCFDEIIYKSKNPYKVELRKMFGFEDSSPGPGSYEPVINKSNKKNSPYQFFGSTVQRFQDENISANEIGPGEYYSENKHTQSKPELRMKKPQSREKTKISTEPSEQSFIVGPGAYELQNQPVCKSSFNSLYNMGGGTFGSKIPRFQSKRPRKYEPKPEYISFMAQQDQQRKKRLEQQFNQRRMALKNKKQAIFVSDTKRNCFQEYQAKAQIPFGNYQVGVSDIGHRIRKQKEAAQQFSDCNLSKPGFLSSVQRFGEDVVQEESHQDCWCRIKEVQKKSIEHVSHVFNSGSKRTEVFEVGNINGPAVGQYSKESSMVKDSFNSRFIKQNQNKTKKLKLWKAKQ